MSVLVLGYGNPGREDDGLGPAFAHRIGEMGVPGVTVSDNYQLVIEDSVSVAEADVVWFVDASREGREPYEVKPVSAAGDTGFTSHLVKPEVVLALAQTYYGKAPKAYLLGIRGYSFEFREGLTPGARNNLNQALEALSARVSQA